MKLKGLINVEFKYHDLAFCHEPVTAIGELTYLNLVPQGDSVLLRDGAQFRNKSMEIRFSSVMNGTITETHVRMVLGIHKNVNGTTLTPADVFEAVVPNSPRNYDNQKNVIILKEWNMGQNLESTHLIVKKYFTDIDLITRYQTANTDGAVTGQEQGGLFLCSLSDQASLVRPIINVRTRLRYVDN